MATGDNIKRLRKHRGMTQKELGRAIGFDERTADVRIAQYEGGARTPKEKYINGLAWALDVEPPALTTPDIDNDIGLMHTLFTLEDVYGLKIAEIDGELCLALDRTRGETYDSMYRMFRAWYKESKKVFEGEITEDEYDNWRYKYPRLDKSGQWAKVPSEELSDYLVKAFSKKLRD
jgi:transcriptional regulator with XRE-family HTH domain